MTARRLRSLLPFFLLVSSAFAQSAVPQVDRVMAEALKPSPVAENLRRLTDEIGGRVPGTPAMDKAILWAQEAFQSAGADSVHTEAFQLPVSWSEGETRMQIVFPTNAPGAPAAEARFSTRVVSLAWSPPFQGSHARMLDLGNGTEDDFRRAGNVQGAVLLIHSDVLKTWEDLFNEYLKGPAIVDRALRGHAAAVALMSSREHDVLYRHITFFDSRIAPLPMLLVAREDAERVARLLAAGRQVFADLAMPNRVGGAVSTANVVAELRGSEHPEQFVVLGAHLDSWELGTGALDNGCNAALVIDALRALKAAGVRPRRSIRFILFSGEEQGLLGSLAYVRRHRAELDHNLAVVIFDTGIGRVTGYSLGGRKDVAPLLAGLLAPLKTYDATEFTFDAPVGTDNFDFLLEGVPTLIANQEPANYMVNYHASSDTYDKVDIAQLKKHVAIAAATMLAIADAPGPIGPRQSRAQIEQLLRDSGLEDQMRSLRLWESWENGSRGRAR